MSLSATLRKAVYAAPITLALATNAMAGTKLPRIEPSTTDLSTPITKDVCVDSTPHQPELSDWNKLVSIMSARGQMIALEGNQVVTGKVTRQEVMFTVSNNFTGNEGYIITSDVSHDNRIQSPKFCITPVETAKEVDMNAFGRVPSLVNQGELGIALTNHDKANSKVAFVGIFSQGSLLAVHFNPKTHRGGWKESDATGNHAIDVALESFDYSDKMKAVFAQRLSSRDKNKNH